MEDSEFALPTLTLFLGADLVIDRETLDLEWGGFQSEAFENCGIMLPVLDVRPDPGLAPKKVELGIDDERWQVKSDLPDDDQQVDLMSRVAPVVVSQVERFLDTHLVQFYLDKVASDHPALIEAVNIHFDSQTLTGKLRELLKAYSSIRNLPTRLEELLAEAVETNAAESHT